MARYDVLIVGGGPAGAWTAHELARRGARVAIVDASHPREKPCGGGVTGRALAIAGEGIARRLGDAVTAVHARLEADSTSRKATVPLGPGQGEAPSALVIADRTRFDRALLDAAQEAGATLVAERASDVGDDCVVRTAAGRVLRGDLVVGADGATSLVRRRLGEPFAKRDLSIATGFFARGVTSRDIVLRSISSPPGYIWSFPRPDHLAIGVCAPADMGVTSSTLRAITAAWIDRAQIAARACLDAYAWPIPTLSPRTLRRQRVAGSRWLLVGDAAGLVDPLTREGIYYALRSGQIAAAALAGGAGGPRAYERAVGAELYPELLRAARAREWFFSPRFTALLIDALAESERIRRVMADLVAGAQPYRGLRRRLAATLETRLAWRLLKTRWLPAV